jgi:hypothetical protein
MTSSIFGKKKAPPVTNILTWVECFRSLVSVLSQKYPSFLPELMAYMSLIVKCQKRFEGLGWFNYDRAFRRQAAITRSMNWSRMDSTLFSLAFMGKAKKSSSCDICFSSNHSSCRFQFWWSSMANSGDCFYTESVVQQVDLWPLQ